METNIAPYQECIKELLSDYLSLSTPETEIKLSFDDERMCYLVMRVGWFEQYTRIHRCLIHLEIVDGSVVIQANNTEDELIPELVRKGIPRNLIRNGAVPDDFLAYAEQRERSAQRIESRDMQQIPPAEQFREPAPPLVSHA